MPELLLEIFSEEIPARMQSAAVHSFTEMLSLKIREEGLHFEKVRSFITPRRLVVVIEGLPEGTKSRMTEKRGPRVDAPKQALDGFLKASGMKLEQLKEVETDKGKFYFAFVEEKGRATKTILSSLIEKAIETFVWPKSMRWNAHQIVWVRPLKNILCIFGGEVIPVRFGHIASNNQTFGHRFLSDGKAITVKNFADYHEKIFAASVVIDSAERKNAIQQHADEITAKKGFLVKEDAGLLEEVSGLVEWPEVLMGEIDAQFMNLPPEVLSTSMRSHQKYFSVLDKSGKLQPYFIVVSNIRSKDKGAAIITGNQRVLRARLSDAKFFWEQDSKQKLENRIKALGNVTYHAKLGSYLDKTKRIAMLARHIAKFTGVDPVKAEKAAFLSKADLLTGMVGEFPELQGIMGGYYAKLSGEGEDVATAIREHYYYPATYSSNGVVTKNHLSITVAIADKIDTLAGMFAASEKPTGSKDPFALRRAGLGIIKMVLENNLRLKLEEIFAHALGLYDFKISYLDVVRELNEFMVDRLKVYLKEQGVRHDLIAAVAEGNKGGDLYFMVKRAEALSSFVASEDGVNLLAAYRRAANIVKQEEKKDKIVYAPTPEKNLLKDGAEITLLNTLDDKDKVLSSFLAEENLEEAMLSLSKIRKTVDDFFEKIMVNAEDKNIRANRLKLLAKLRSAMDSIADFSKIEG